MNFEFWTQAKHLPHLQESLTVKVLDKDPSDGMIKVRIAINNDIDALYLFHAGIMSTIKRS